MIHVRCHCGATLPVPLNLVGQTLLCTDCQGALRLASAAPSDSSGDFNCGFIIHSGPVNVGERLLLGGYQPIEIGRLPERHLWLPGRMVSRLHARLIRVEEGWRIEDCDSANGLYLNAERISAEDLSDGDVVDIGEFELHYFAGTPDTAGDVGHSTTAQGPAGSPSETGLA